MCSLFVVGTRPPASSVHPLNGSAVIGAVESEPLCSASSIFNVLGSIEPLTSGVAAGTSEVADVFNVRSVTSSTNDLLLSAEGINGFSTNVFRRGFSTHGKQNGVESDLSILTSTLIAKKVVASDVPAGTDASVSFYPRYTFGNERRQLKTQMPRDVASLFADTFSEGIPKRQEVFDDNGVLLLRFLDYVTDSIVSRSSTDPGEVRPFVVHPLIKAQLAAGGVQSSLKATFLDSVFGVASDEVGGIQSIEIERDVGTEVLTSPSQKRVLLASNSSNSESSFSTTDSSFPASTSTPPSTPASSTSEESWLAYAHLSHDEIQRRLYQYKRVSVYFRLRSKLGAARPIRFGVQPLQPLMDDHPRDGCSLREMDTRTHIPHQEHTLHTLVASSNPFSPVVPDTLRSSFHDKYFQDLVEGGNYADIFTTAGTTRRLLSTSESSASTTEATTPVSSASTNPTFTSGTTSTTVTSSTAAVTTLGTTTAIPTTVPPTSALSRELPPTSDALELYRVSYLAVPHRTISISPSYNAAALVSDEVTSRGMPLGPVVGVLRVVNGILGGYLSPTVSLLVGLFYMCTGARVVDGVSATFGQDSCLSCFGDHSFDLAGLDPIGPLAVLAPFMSILDANTEGRFPTMSIGALGVDFGSKTADIDNMQRAARLSYVSAEAERLRGAAALAGVSLPTLRSRLLLGQLVREVSTLLSTSGNCPPAVVRPDVRYFNPNNLQYVRGGLVLTLSGYIGASVGWLVIAVMVAIVRVALGFTHNRVLQDVLRAGMGWPSVLLVYPLSFLIQGGVSLSVTTLHYYVLLGTFTDVDTTSKTALYASLRTYVPEGAPSTFFPTNSFVSDSTPTTSTFGDFWGCTASKTAAPIEYASNTDNLLLDVGLCFVQLIFTSCLLLYVLLATVVMFPGYHSIGNLVTAMLAGKVKPGAIVFIGEGELEEHSPRLGRWASGIPEDKIMSVCAPLESSNPSSNVLDMHFLELTGDAHVAKEGRRPWFSARGVWCAVPVTQIGLTRGECGLVTPHLLARHQLRRMLISTEPSASRMTTGDKYLAKHCRWFQDEPIPQFKKDDAAEFAHGEGSMNPHHLRSGLFWEGSLMMCLTAAVFAGIFDGLILTEDGGFKGAALAVFSTLWTLLSFGAPVMLSWRQGQFRNAMFSQAPLLGGGILCSLASYLFLVGMPILLAIIYVVGAIYFIVLYGFYGVLYLRRLMLWSQWLGLRGRDAAADDPPPLVSPCSSVGDADDNYRVFTLQDLIAASDPIWSEGEVEEMLPMKKELN